MHSAKVTRRTLLGGALAAGLAACATEGISASTGLLGHRRLGRGAEPVVVLHEWMGDHSNYDSMLPYLSEDTASWVFADLRGYGMSKGLAGAYSLREAAADVLRLMEYLGYQRFHVVGHSMSGMIAQYLAKQAGGRVKSVVAISPVPASGFKTDEAGIKRLVAIIDDDAAMRAAIEARGGKRHSRGWIDRKLAMARHASTREAMMGYLRMFTSSDVADEVRGTTTPVTVIVGAHDLPLYREESMRKLLAPLFPNLQVEVSQEAGHYAMLETPPRLAGMIERGLQRGV